MSLMGRTRSSAQFPTPSRRPDLIHPPPPSRPAAPSSAPNPPFVVSASRPADTGHLGLQAEDERSQAQPPQVAKPEPRGHDVGVAREAEQARIRERQQVIDADCIDRLAT